ncbi:MAG TPA: hypothetical protein VHA37_06795, partial [Candidatus Saccharimonadales bacterium]|nr:hypothetical protein [Candidatus Saccharimonadales bacterium]
MDLNNDGLYPANYGVQPPLVAGTATDPNTGKLLPVDSYFSSPTGIFYCADTRARQLLARQLYVLMMLLIEDTTNPVQIFLPAPTGMTTAGQAPYCYLNGQQQLAYMVAQWAINVVDYRDSDSIMTPFEFDIYPFNDNNGNPADGTWDVDDIVDPVLATTFPYPTTGISKTDDSNSLGWLATGATATNTYRGLVWGCERPELLLTEAAAFHDRGTSDTTAAANLPSMMADTLVNTADPTQDQDYDQVRRPRGSLIVELFNPNSPLDAPKGDLAPAGVAGVNLAAVVPSPGGTVSPVWRLAILYSSTYDTHLAGAGMPAKPVQGDPRVPTLDQQTPVTLSGGAATYATPVFRAVYFVPGTYAANNYVANSAGTYTGLDVPPPQSFYADPNVVGAALIVPPNQYAIVGPAGPDPTTNNGILSAFAGLRPSGTPASGYTSASMPTNSNPMQFEFGGPANLAQVDVKMGGAGMGPYGAAALPYPGAGYIKQVIGVPIMTNWLAPTTYAPLPGPHDPLTNPGQAAVSTTLRMSISEPLYGYPRFPAGTSNSLYDDSFYYTDVPANNKFPQQPYDSTAGGSAVGINPNPNVGPSTTGTVVTIPAYTTIFLQRLANPLVPWDPNANPYVNVDSMPVDLAAYTGENANAATTPEPTTGYGMSPAAAVATFDSRRRGSLGTNGTSNADSPNVWTPLSIAAPPTLVANAGSITSPMKNSTFGYLNTEYGGVGAYWTIANPPNVGASGVPAAQYYGDPVNPFPWFPWNDRPYNSHYELMQVPASSPSSLLADFGLLYYWIQNEGTGAGAAATYTGGSPYLPPAGPQLSTSPTTPPLTLAPFHHLLNFYDSQTTSRTGGTTTPQP